VSEIQEAAPPVDVDAWTQAIARNPRNASLWRARGLALVALGAFDQAARAFAEALRLDPSPSLRYLRGKEYLRMGEPGMAVAEFTNAVAIEPYFVAALERRAEAFRDLNDLVRAAIDDREALRLRVMTRNRIAAEAAQQESREVPLKTA